jgi:TfoX/Sxy family transcriptional regulator of competence genes
VQARVGKLDSLSSIWKLDGGKPMSSDEKFVKYIADQIKNAGAITYKKMFGEYAIYSNGKLVALVCDDQLFVKPTAGGRTFIGEVTEAPPYPGAKPSFLIEDKFEDQEWLGDLIRITATELPPPKPKKKQGRAK